MDNETDYDSKLADKCAGAARCLTYNGKKEESVAKHVLLAASHQLDSHAVRVRKKRDGLRVINARGKSRFLTWRERLAIWLLGGRMEIRP